MSSRRDFFDGVLRGFVPVALLERIGFAADDRTARDTPSRAISDGLVSVRDHGASGDGRSDDAAAFERANESAPNVLVPPGSYRIGRDVTLSAHLIVARGAVISADRGVRLRIDGAMTAGLYQIFGTDGHVSFGSGSVVEVYPQWWGAEGDGVHDDYDALQAAFRARTVRIPPGKYRITRELTGLNGLRVEGAGSLWNPSPSRDSWIVYDGEPADDVAVMRMSTAGVGVEPGGALSNVHVNSVVLDGAGKAGYGLYAAYCTNESAFSDITVVGATRHGLWANKLWYARFSHITARNNAGCGITLGRQDERWERGTLMNGVYLENLRAHSNGRDRAFHEEENLAWGYGIGLYPGNGVIARNVVSERNDGPGILFGLGGGGANALHGFYVEGNGQSAREDGRAGRNWGLVVIGSANARANEITTGYLGGSVGSEGAQSIWLTGVEPNGTLVLKDLAFGQYLRADWSGYELRDAVYWGLRHYISGHSPEA